MSLFEKPTLGAEVLPPPPISEKSPPSTSKDPYFTATQTIEEESESLPPLEEYDPTACAKPCSPFYSHPQTRTSLEQLKSTSRISLHRSVDLEAAGNTPRLSSVGQDAGLVRTWPGTKSMTRKKHGWGCLQRFSKNQRLAIKIGIAIVLVGTMVAIGVGVSKAVGGGVYKNNNQSTTIGS